MSEVDALRDFADRHRMKGKSPLCVALVVTRRARKHGLPLDANALVTSAGGQVLGLGKAAVQAILKEYDIARVLAQEGGRTSRGSIGKMRDYVAFLNDLHSNGPVDLETIERWWVQRVLQYLAGKPFVLRLDSSKGLRAVIRDLMDQAEKRQAQSPGATFAGTLLQHLVGAKLNLVLGPGVKHHGAAVADEPSGREGDFLIADVAIHVTTSPSESLIRKCQSNLDNGLRPLLITTHRGVLGVEVLAESAGIGERLDVFDAEQFLAGNLYELGRFDESARRTTVEQLVTEYNRIIDDCETDPGLQISVGR